MPPSSDDPFYTRLVAIRDRADLTGLELATFIGVAKSTMEAWLRGAIPHGYTRRQVEPGLKALEAEMARKEPRFPVPLKIRQKDRLAYVKRIRGLHR